MEEREKKGEGILKVKGDKCGQCRLLCMCSNVIMKLLTELSNID